ncbi:MAG: DUF4238 domain-containing protein [Sedimentisphaerales bacterium]|nr:DUF4238 domain-containing protein [Sedimentisphaerales bacterium]
MAKKRNHYIPRVLLARFASRRDGKKAWVWQLSQGKEPTEVSVRDAGVATYFYGRPETRVEERLSQQEARITTVLDAIEAGANPANHDRELRHWLHTLTARTRHLRDGFSDAATALIEELVNSADSESAQSAGRAYIDANFDELMLETLAEFPEHQKHFFIDALRRDPSYRAFLRGYMTSLVSQHNLGKLVKDFLSRVQELADVDELGKDGQVRGLSKLLNARDRESPISVDSWHLIKADSTELVLGDCCTFVIDKSGDAYPLLAASSEDRREIYVPLSKRCTAVGTRSSTTPSLTAPEINLAAAKVSRDTLFAGSLDPTILQLSKTIGTSSSLLGRESTSGLVEEVWEEMRRKPRGNKRDD